LLIDSRDSILTNLINRSLRTSTMMPTSTSSLALSC